MIFFSLIAHAQNNLSDVFAAFQNRVRLRCFRDGQHPIDRGFHGSALDLWSYIFEYISRNYHKNITNEELASLTGLSAVYFRKLFTDVMGISPIAYVHEIRIRKAKGMLKSDYGILSDLAQTLGYSGLLTFRGTSKNIPGYPRPSIERALSAIHGMYGKQLSPSKYDRKL